MLRRAAAEAEEGRLPALDAAVQEAMKAVAAAEHSAAQLEAQAQSVRDKEQTKARVAALREALGLGPLGAGAARGSEPPPPSSYYAASFTPY